MPKPAPITIVNVGYRSTNYWVVNAGTSRLLVDLGWPGTMGRMRASLDRMGVPLTEIRYGLATHCHIDHILGVAFLAAKFDIPFIIHPGEKPLFTHSRNQAHVFGLSLEMPPEPGGFLNEGDPVRFGESELEVIHIPGHSPGGILLHCPEQKFLISGDVLFRESIGRSDLPGGDYESLVGGIKQKLLGLDPDTKVYPGHGPPTSIGEENALNPFLR